MVVWCVLLAKGKEASGSSPHGGRPRSAHTAVWSVIPSAGPRHGPAMPRQAPPGLAEPRRPPASQLRSPAEPHQAAQGLLIVLGYSASWALLARVLIKTTKKNLGLKAMRVEVKLGTMVLAGRDRSPQLIYKSV